LIYKNKKKLQDRNMPLPTVEKTQNTLEEIKFNQDIFMEYFDKMSDYLKDVRNIVKDTYLLQID